MVREILDDDRPADEGSSAPSPAGTATLTITLPRIWARSWWATSAPASWCRTSMARDSLPQAVAVAAPIFTALALGMAAAVGPGGAALASNSGPAVPAPPDVTLTSSPTGATTDPAGADVAPGAAGVAGAAGAAGTGQNPADPSSPSTSDTTSASASATVGGPAAGVPPATSAGVAAPAPITQLLAPAAGGPPPSSGAALVPAVAASAIPARASTAYLVAAARTAATTPRCHLDWSLLAAIGRVESNHARTGGSGLTADGRATIAILGPRLDGSGGNSAVRDTDHGLLDGDTVWDRAVGPMQFLPGTWKAYAVDGDGDGRTDPQDIDDAAATAARYLCAGGGDLSTSTGRWAAAYRYNHSASYANLVEALAVGYAAQRPATSAPAVATPTAARTTTPPVPPTTTPSGPVTSTTAPPSTSVPTSTATATQSSTSAPRTTTTTAPTTSPTTVPTTAPTTSTTGAAAGTSAPALTFTVTFTLGIASGSTTAK